MRFFWSVNAFRLQMKITRFHRGQEPPNTRNTLTEPHSLLVARELKQKKISNPFCFRRVARIQKKGERDREKESIDTRLGKEICVDGGVNWSRRKTSENCLGRAFECYPSKMGWEEILDSQGGAHSRNDEKTWFGSEKLLFLLVFSMFVCLVKCITKNWHRGNALGESGFGFSIAIVASFGWTKPHHAITRRHHTLPESNRGRRVSQAQHVPQFSLVFERGKRVVGPPSKEKDITISRPQPIKLSYLAVKNRPNKTNPKMWR